MTSAGTVLARRRGRPTPAFRRADVIPHGRLSARSRWIPRPGRPRQRAPPAVQLQPQPGHERLGPQRRQPDPRYVLLPGKTTNIGAQAGRVLASDPNRDSIRNHREMKISRRHARSTGPAPAWWIRLAGQWAGGSCQFLTVAAAAAPSPPSPVGRGPGRSAWLSPRSRRPGTRTHAEADRPAFCPVSGTFRPLAAPLWPAAGGARCGTASRAGGHTAMRRWPRRSR